jgi:hypothetical protein
VNIKHVLPAIWLLVSFAASIAVTPTHAQTLDQNFSKQLSEASLRIFSSRLSLEYQEYFYDKLLQITAESSCREVPSKQPRAFECKGAQPTNIEAALAKIEKLNVEMNATFALVGTQTVRYVYDRKLRDLGEKMRFGKIDGVEAKPLLERVATFFGSTDPKRLLNVAEVDAKYQVLAADVDAAIKLSAASSATSSFLIQYKEKLAELQRKIDRTTLNPVTKADLKSDLVTLSAPMLTPYAKFSPTEFAKADADLNTFNTRVEQTVLTEGSKSFKELATAKLKILSDKINTASLSSKDRAPLDVGIAALTRQIDSVSDSILKQQGRLSLDTFDAQVAKLSTDIDETIARAAAAGRQAIDLSRVVNDKTTALKTKIEQSRLNAFFQNDFLLQLFLVDESVRANCLSKPPGRPGLTCDLPTLVNADKQLDAISATVDKIVATYGTTSVEAIYGVPLRQAQSNLNNSRVSPVDKTRLSKNLTPIFAMIQEANNTVRRLPTSGRNTGAPERLHNEVTAAIDEINAAIRLMAPK